MVVNKPILGTLDLISTSFRNQNINKIIKNYCEMVGYSGQKKTPETFIQRMHQSISKKQEIMVFPYKPNLESFLKILQEYGLISAYFIVHQPQIFLIYIPLVFNKQMSTICSLKKKVHLQDYCSFQVVRKLSKNTKQTYIYRHALTGRYCTADDLLKNKQGGMLVAKIS